MKLKATIKPDVQLLAMMVAKVLRTEHHIDTVPTPGDYKVLEADTRFNGSTDIQVAIALERGLTFSVKQHWWGDDDRDIQAILDAATEMAENIASVHELRREIIDMTFDVRAAATREIVKAKRRGLPYRLISTMPYSIRDSVRDGIAVTVMFQSLSEAVRLEHARFDADCAADVVKAFEGCHEEQQQRNTRRAQLDAAGATGRIDSVVVNAMQEAGHDLAEVLQLLADSDDWIVDIGERGDEKRMFRLHWDKGDVYAPITIGDGVSWHKGQLTFQKAPGGLTRAAGRRVRDIVDNPILGDIRVTSGSGKEGESCSLRCTQDLLHFDADTGRLWAA